MKGYEILLEELRKTKKDLKVADIMTSNVKTISPESSMYDAIEDMKKYRIHGLIVTEGSVPEGIVTTYDAMLVIARGDVAEKTRVGDVMSKSLVYTSPDETVLGALEKMLDNQFTKLPVVENGKLSGILSATDVIDIFDTGFLEGQKPEGGKRGLIVDDIMHDPINIDQGKSVYEAAKLMAENEVGEILVAGDALGIITEKDIFKKIVAKGKDPKDVKTEDIMSSPCITIESGKDLIEASRLFSENGIRRLPVTREGDIIGILSIEEIAKTIAKRHRML